MRLLRASPLLSSLSLVVALVAVACAREAPQAAETPAAVHGDLVPVGSTTRVALEQPIDSATSRRGDRFRVRFLTPLRTDTGVVVVPEGAYAYGHVEGTAERSVTIAFDWLVTPDGRTVPFEARILSAVPEAAVVAGRGPVTSTTTLEPLRMRGPEERIPPGGAVGGGPSVAPVTLPIGTELDLILLRPILP